MRRCHIRSERRDAVTLHAPTALNTTNTTDTKHTKTSPRRQPTENDCRAGLSDRADTLRVLRVLRARCGRPWARASFQWTSVALVLWLSLLTSLACERETRRYREIPAAASRPGSVRITQLEPGMPAGQPPLLSPYQENAYGIAEGKRLFVAFNCNGCHAHGGGGIGPPLMDEKWIYGYEPDQIYSTIAQGRPDGMPAFGSKVPSQQIWQLVAYVQALGMQVPRDAAPGRDDDMNAMEPELRLGPREPRQTGHR